MKQFVLTILFFAFAIVAFPKDRFVMAKIIMNNNDTLVNAIKYEKLFDFQNKFEMVNDDGTRKTVFPLDAKGFYIVVGVKDTVYFESNCGLKFGLADNVDKNCYFIMKQNSGKAPLYYFTYSKLYSAGVNMQSVNSPCYLSKYRGEWIMMEESNYIEQIIKLIKPFKRTENETIKSKLAEFESALKSRNYPYDDMQKIFVSINKILNL